jgi:hypothetical protein
MASGAYGQGAMVVAHSMRNRFTGLVTRVVRDGSGEDPGRPHRFVSLLGREAALPIV